MFLIYLHSEIRERFSTFIIIIIIIIILLYLRIIHKRPPN